MTERFNFYDLYGYVIPGLTLVGLLWIPFGLQARAWPDFQWSSAFIALVAAYLLGLVVNRTANRFAPPQVWDGARLRYPSDLLLDPDGARVHQILGVSLGDVTRSAVAEAIYRTFRIDPLAKPESRGDAFILCRSILQSEATSYAEQFEGLYTLCQMIAVTLLLAGWYYVGWAISAWVPPPVSTILLLLAAGLLWTLHETTWAHWSFLALLLGSFGLGATLAGRFGQPDTAEAHLLLGLAITVGVLALPIYSAFRYFAGLFAVAVYRDFYSLVRAKQAFGANHRT